MNLVQIGANRGNDHVTKLIKESKKAFDKIVLVEPIEFVLEELKACYLDVQNVIIEKCIISTSKEKFQKIFYHRGSNYGPSTLNKTHLTDHGCPDDDIEFFEIENRTLTELLAKHKYLSPRLSVYRRRRIRHRYFDESRFIVSDCRKYPFRNRPLRWRI